MLDQFCDLDWLLSRRWCRTRENVLMVIWLSPQDHWSRNMRPASKSIGNFARFVWIRRVGWAVLELQFSEISAPVNWCSDWLGEFGREFYVVTPLHTLIHLQEVILCRCMHACRLCSCLITVQSLMEKLWCRRNSHIILSKIRQVSCPIGDCNGHWSIFANNITFSIRTSWRWKNFGLPHPN